MVIILLTLLLCDQFFTYLPEWSSSSSIQIRPSFAQCSPNDSISFRKITAYLTFWSLFLQRNRTNWHMCVVFECVRGGEFKRNRLTHFICWKVMKSAKLWARDLQQSQLCRSSFSPWVTYSLHITFRDCWDLNLVISVEVKKDGTVQLAIVLYDFYVKGGNAM